MDIYLCEECGKIFDEFEMNFRAAQEDKKRIMSGMQEAVRSLDATNKTSRNGDRE